MWFEQLTGFKETSGDDVSAQLKIEGDAFVSSANNQKFAFGKLEIPTLRELKEQSPALDIYKDKIKVSEILGDVQQLHRQPENAHALFQAASQFNLLEMVSPNITPEQGVDRYEKDFTQGPACAIACGAGTIYRNYFVPVGNQIGQSASQQVDCLQLIGKALNNEQLNLWEMKNGYALANQEGLKTISKHLDQLTNEQRANLKAKLKVGIQWNTEVTIAPTKHKVSQIYCSALPVDYSFMPPNLWESFARLILEATYEATLYTALLNLNRNHSNKVFLTLVGGGAFGNDATWILESLQQALRKFKHVPLDVRVVSFGRSNTMVLKLVDEI